MRITVLVFSASLRYCAPSGLISVELRSNLMSVCIENFRLLYETDNKRMAITVLVFNAVPRCCASLSRICFRPRSSVVSVYEWQENESYCIACVTMAIFVSVYLKVSGTYINNVGPDGLYNWALHIEMLMYFFSLGKNKILLYVWYENFNFRARWMLNFPRIHMKGFVKIISVREEMM